MKSLLLILISFCSYANIRKDTANKATEIFPDSIMTPKLIIHSNNNRVAVFESNNFRGAFQEFRTQGQKVGRVGVSYQTLYLSNPNDMSISSESGKVILGTGILQRLVVTNGGNVGIGTTNPVKKFEVHGESFFNGISRHSYIKAEVLVASIPEGIVFADETGKLFSNLTIPQSMVSHLNDSLTTNNIGVINGLYLPKKTTSEILSIISPTAGQVVFDTTQGVLAYYNGTEWRKLLSASL